MDLDPFELTFDDYDQLKARVDSIGIKDEYFPRYWRMAMEALEHELEITAQELLNQDQEVTSEIGIGTSEYRRRIDEFKSNVSKISWSDSDMTLSPTQFINKFFAFCMTPKKFGYEAYRDMFEWLGPTSQCNAAEKNLEALLDWNICYICGNEILDRYNPKSTPIRGEMGVTKYPHSSRQCEHVLPAFTALGYNGLIQSSKILNNTSDEKVLKFYQHEYAQSHECCNQEKSDDLWIIYDAQQGKYVIDDAALEKTLRKIFRSNKYDCREFLSKNRTDEKQFVAGRASYIRRVYLEPLLELINEQKNDFRDLHFLAIRIRQITALRVNRAVITQIILSGQYTAPVIFSTKLLTLKMAKTEAYARFKDPIGTFTKVFLKLFSALNSQKEVQRAFGFLVGRNGLAFRSLEDTHKKTFTNGLQLGTGSTGSFMDMHQRLVEELVVTKLPQLFDGANPDSQVDETTIIPIINMQVASLEKGFRHGIKQILEVSLTKAPEESKAFFTLFYEKFKVNFNVEDSVVNEEFQEFAKIGAASYETLVPLQTGGSKKKSQTYKKKMVGGEPDILLEVDELKNEIYQSAVNAGVNVKERFSDLQGDVFAVQSREAARRSERERIRVGRFTTFGDNVQGVQFQVGQTAVRMAYNPDGKSTYNVDAPSSTHPVYPIILFSDKNVSGILFPVGQQQVRLAFSPDGTIMYHLDLPDPAFPGVSQTQFPISNLMGNVQGFVINPLPGVQLVRLAFSPDRKSMYNPDILIPRPNFPIFWYKGKRVISVEGVHYTVAGGSKRKVKSNKRSNMNRKTRKNRFSLLGKRTPSARIPKTRTKTQSAKPKQRKMKTLRIKQK